MRIIIKQPRTEMVRLFVHFEYFYSVSGIFFSNLNEYFRFYREKEGVDVTKIDHLKGRFEIHNKENNFIIRDTLPEDAGKYTCRLPDNTFADIEVIGEYDCHRLFIILL